MKSVLISIKPKYCELIANGKKTVEVRKTRPRIDVPFKCYIYCTKGNEILGWHSEYKDNIRDNEHEYKVFTLHGQDKNAFNGKVIGEFVCDRIDEIGYSPEMHGQYVSNIENLHEVSCVNFEEMFDYIADGFGYGWHISNLVIYDEPKELQEFKTKCKEWDKDNPNCDGCRYFVYYRGYEYDESDCACNGLKPVERPPMSWCYVEELGV